MDELPTIQSIGLPPEKHADRIVGAMMRIIVRDRARRWRKILDVLSNGRRTDGNPKGQAKLHARLREAVKGYLLGSALQSGKRGRYKLYLMILDGWDAERKDFIHEDDRIPEKPWIALSTVQIESKGDHQYDDVSGVCLLITHHAMSRLAQRCGARSLKEIYSCVRRIARTYCDEFDGAKPAPRYYHLRVELPYDLGTAVCALEQYYDGEGGMVVATLWKEGDAEGLKLSEAV
jgi:hypothetical protein